MSRLLRLVSTLMIGAGLGFLIIYNHVQMADKTSILDQPSFYVVKNYWLMFVAGILVLLFSELGSFFSWFRQMDPEKEALPNAGYASSKDIQTWVGRPEADEAEDTTVITEEKRAISVDDQTVIISKEEIK